MAKTEEELTELKERFENLERELDSLSDEELEKVTGGKVTLIGYGNAAGKKEFCK